MSGKRGTRRWLGRHLADTWVREAGARGYRSRAAFKLAQIDDAERLLRPGATVVDLGAAPGGWSQVAAERVGATGRVLAVDVLEMAPLPGVAILQGDFTDPAVRDALAGQLPDGGAHLVMSDMAPNLTGVKDTDQARAAELALAAMDFAVRALEPRGAILLKVFHGRSMQDLVREARGRFRSVKVRKPEASRARSAEVYLLGKGVSGIF